jgi:hypothetical protein
MLKSLGFVVPRGGAATKAEREGRLPSLQLSSVKSVAEPTPVKASVRVFAVVYDICFR